MATRVPIVLVFIWTVKRYVRFIQEAPRRRLVPASGPPSRRAPPTTMTWTTSGSPSRLCVLPGAGRPRPANDAATVLLVLTPTKQQLRPSRHSRQATIGGLWEGGGRINNIGDNDLQLRPEADDVDGFSQGSGLANNYAISFRASPTMALWAWWGLDPDILSSPTPPSTNTSHTSMYATASERESPAILNELISLILKPLVSAPKSRLDHRFGRWTRLGLGA